jgi:Ser/Thr protein kinase RdoA (MazF antagonist)
MDFDLKTIGAMFRIPGDFLFGNPYGSGHINDTFAVSYSQGGAGIRYIFQRINHNIFKNPVALMDNISRVTSHQAKKQSCLTDSSRKNLTLIPALDGKPYAQDRDGNYWRVYIFIEKARTYDVLESEKQAFQAAKAFGEFQKLLSDLPGERLNETILNFHNTPSRYRALEDAIKQDSQNRAAEAKQEIDFVMKRAELAGKLLELNKQGKIPERVTHNDTKLNNVMLDDCSGEGICVIDLDTVMPGLVLYDFGDMVRTGTSPAAEDEKDLSKVFMQMPMFKALLEGYLAGAGDFLTATEKEYLPFSGKLIALEIGVRFLTDYLAGDVYFKIHRPEHNLDRCRTQFKLVQSIEEQEEEMQRLLDQTK